MRKVCFKCGVDKDISEYYKHPQMGDGTLNKCKCCAKLDTRKYREDNTEKVRSYDRIRGKIPKRIAENSERMIKYKETFPQRCLAVKMLGNAVRDGRIVKKDCAICGTSERIEGHHFDYYKPLEVIWLCSAHHSAVHEGMKKHFKDSGN